MIGTLDFISNMSKKFVEGYVKVNGLNPGVSVVREV